MGNNLAEKKELWELDKLIKEHRILLANLISEQQIAVEKFTKELKQLNSERDNLVVSNKDLSNKLNELNSTIELKKQELESLKIQKDNFKNLSDKLSNVEKDIKIKEKELSDLISQINSTQQSLKVCLDNLSEKEGKLSTLSELVVKENKKLEETKKNNTLESERQKAELQAGIDARENELASREGDLSRREEIYEIKIGKLKQFKSECEVYYNRICPIKI